MEFGVQQRHKTDDKYFMIFFYFYVGMVYLSWMQKKSMQNLSPFMNNRSPKIWLRIHRESKNQKKGFSGFFKRTCQNLHTGTVWPHKSSWEGFWTLRASEPPNWGPKRAPKGPKKWKKCHIFGKHQSKFIKFRIQIAQRYKRHEITLCFCHIWMFPPISYGLKGTLQKKSMQNLFFFVVIAMLAWVCVIAHFPLEW